MHARRMWRFCEIPPNAAGAPERPGSTRRAVERPALIRTREAAGDKELRD
jgi:hypothetical protein